jgi:hypothetical protein
LLHTQIAGVANDPPSDTADGDCWLVDTAPSGDWAGHSGELAVRQAGAWLFVRPRAGMRVFDSSTGHDIRFVDAWQRPARPAAPSGGATIDAEGRAALSALVEALSLAGVLPAA